MTNKAWSLLFSTWVPEATFEVSVDADSRKITVRSNDEAHLVRLQAIATQPSALGQRYAYGLIKKQPQHTINVHDVAMLNAGLEAVSTPFPEINDDELVERLFLQSMQKDRFSIPIMVQTSRPETMIRIDPTGLNADDLECAQASMPGFAMLMQKRFAALGFAAALQALHNKTPSASIDHASVADENWNKLKKLVVTYDKESACLRVDSSLLRQFLAPVSVQATTKMEHEKASITFNMDHLANQMLVHSGEIVLSEMDGQPHPIFIATPKSSVTTKVRVNMVIDTSSSVSDFLESYMDALYAFGQSLMHGKTGRRAQYMTFDSTISKFQRWDTEKKLELRPRGRTKLFDTIIKVDQYLQQTAKRHPNQQEITVLLTDGEDNASSQRLDDYAWQAIAQSEQKFCVVGIGSCDTKTLQRISDINQTPWIHAHDGFSKLAQKLLQQADHLQTPRSAVTVWFQTVGEAWEPLTTRFESELRLHTPSKPVPQFVVGSNLKFRDCIYDVCKQVPTTVCALPLSLSARMQNMLKRYAPHTHTWLQGKLRMDAPQLGAWPVVAHAFALCYGLCMQALLYTRVWAWEPARNYLANTSIVNDQQRVWLEVRYESTATAMRVYVASPAYNAMVQSLHGAGYLLNTLVAWCVFVKQGLYNGQKERHAKACNRAEQTDAPCIPAAPANTAAPFSASSMALSARSTAVEADAGMCIHEQLAHTTLSAVNVRNGAQNDGYHAPVEEENTSDVANDAHAPLRPKAGS